MSRSRSERTVSVLGTALLASAAVAWSMGGASGDPDPVSAADGLASTATSITLPDVLPTTSSSTTTSSTSTTTSSSTTTSPSTTTTTVPPTCDGTRNRGRTDVGVTAKKIILGAVTVDSGIAGSFLRDETTALQAVVARVNASGGLCDRTIDLEVRDSGWDPTLGYEEIQSLSKRVFVLVVNPDSQGLKMASDSGFLQGEGLPVIGTDGLLANQLHDPYIWPVGPSMAGVMHVIADAQYASGMRHPSIVYETTFGVGRDGADAYSNEWARLTGSGVPGYSSTDECSRRFCGIPAFAGSYTTQAARLAEACGQAPACDSGVVGLDPDSAVNWFRSNGRFGGIADPSGGAGAAPPLLFNRSFAMRCGTRCEDMRLWTAFLPPVAPFDTEPAVARYVDDMRAVSATVDVENQYAEAAYVGAELAVHTLLRASGMPGGLTRENVVQALDTTVGWDNGLTVAPLSWSPGNHHAATTLHAFDLFSQPGTVAFRYVENSARTDPFVGQV